MRWRLIIEEFGPNLRYIKGENNIVADALSRLELTEEEFSPECFAFDDDTDDEAYPLAYAKIRTAQQQDNTLQQTFQGGTRQYTKRQIKHSDHS